MGTFGETMHPSVCIEAIEKLGKINLNFFFILKLIFFSD
jgi:hypothetical protein